MNLRHHRGTQNRFRVARAVLAGLLLVGAVTITGQHHVRAATPLPDGASSYVPLLPTRIVDTRPSAGRFGFTTVDANTIRIDITHRAGVPVDASAAVVNITMISAAGPNYVVAFPTGSRVPATSNVNTDFAGQVMANLAHVKVGDGGSIDLRMSRPVALAVDLVGVYVPTTDAVAAGRLVTIPTGAQRVLDTRKRGYPAGPGSVTTVDLTPAGVPVNASSVVVTVTAVQGQSGYWTAYTSGRARPPVSTLNLDAAGQTRANQAIVQMNGSTRSIDVYSTGGGHLLIDVVGWFTGATATLGTSGLFVPSTPFRILDTRLMRTLAPWAGSTFEFATGTPITEVAAIATNVTAHAAWSPGFVTAHPAGTALPNSSTLNIPGWQQVIAAHAIVPVSTRGGALFTNAGAHLIADIAGWYLGTPLTPTRAPQPNPNYAPTLVTTVHVPSLGIAVGARSGTNSTQIVDQGLVAVTGTLDKLASPGNVMLFAHRTTGAAPFRYIDRLKAGDAFTLVGADGRSYRYVVVSRSVSSPVYEAISALAVGAGPVTAQLIACSRADGSPGGIAYRIVVTGRLVAVG